MRLRSISALILGVFLLGSCADLSTLDPCEQFAQLVEERGQVEALDPVTTTADEARDLTQSILDELEDFETASDGLFAIQIENYRIAIKDIQQLLVDVDGEATAEEWAPLLVGSLRDSTRAFAQLRSAVEPACES